MSEPAVEHAALMDSTYRYQRLIYDATRRYYLLGRNRLIEALEPPKGGQVLEIACGTGRNLRLIADRYPDCHLHGLDISEEMLRTASMNLQGRARLARADACGFDADALFGTARFDRIILSYSLSMIPDWTRALEVAVAHLAENGELHVVDFGDQAELPTWFRTMLRSWLTRFHVQPREDLQPVLASIAAEAGATFTAIWLQRHYAQYCVLARRAPAV